MKRLACAAAAVAALLSLAGRAAAADDVAVAAARIEAGVSAVLVGIGDALSRAAKDLGQAGLDREHETRKILRECAAGKPYVVDAAFIDDAGVLRVIEPGSYRQHEGADVSGQEVAAAVRASRKPMMGSVFLPVEGARSVDVEYPVFSAEGRRYLGAVSLLVNQEQAVRGVAAAVERASRVNCWVMQRDGLIIYETDPTQLGLNLFTAPLYREYPELLALGRRQVAEREGTGSYTFLIHGTTTRVKKLAAWRTASLFGGDWIVVAYREAD